MVNNRATPISEDEKQFDEQVITIDRVARVVKGGRRFRFRALVVVGDHKTQVGVGIAKAGDVQTAVSKAATVAKKNMLGISLENGTIPHEVKAKHAGSQVLLKPAGLGTGIIAGGVVRAILELGGVQNVLSKSYGSSNKLNTAHATLKALAALVPKRDWVTTKKAKVVNKSGK